MSETFIHNTYECLGLRTRFVDAPIEGDDWVVTVSYYILMKFFYFVPVSGDVIFGFNKGENLCFHFMTILYGELYTLFILGISIIRLLRTNCMLGFF